MISWKNLLTFVNCKVQLFWEEKLNFIQWKGHNPFFFDLAKISDNKHIRFDGNDLNPCNTVKNLGVHIDKYMTFETHIDEMYKKVMGILIFFNRVKNNIPVCTRVLLVQALALSIINYCSKVWGMAQKTQIQRVQKLQNFASKVATANAKKYDRATPYINSLKWLKIEA